MAFGLSAGAVAMIGAGATVASGMMAADAAGDAADTQAASADRATDAQRQMFERQVELQAPWREAGGAGLNRLAFEMGLSPTGFYGPGGAAPAPIETEAQIRARLRADFPVQQAQGPSNTMTQQQMPMSAFYTEGLMGTPPPPTASGAAPYDSAYEAAVQAELARQQTLAQSNAQATAAAGSDPNYGNLLRTFGAADFEADPGYAFRKEEQERALMRSAAAQGGVGSGKFLKDAMRFSGGLAAQEYGSAFDRFNVGQTNKFNRLASLSGIGQTAANQTGAAAANFGAQMGNNIIGAGNARAAGQVGAANALNGAIGQGTSMYQTNQLMQQLNRPSGGGGFGTGAAFGNQDYGQFL